MTKSNEKSLELIKQIYQPDLKPSQILELADQTNVRQISEVFNDHGCGYCARGFINQFLTAGEFDYWFGNESTWDRRRNILKLENGNLDYNYADQKLIALKKYGKPLDKLNMAQYSVVSDIIIRIQN